MQFLIECVSNKCSRFSWLKASRDHELTRHYLLSSPVSPWNRLKSTTSNNNLSLVKPVQYMQQQFTNSTASGAYKSLVNLALPDRSSPDYTPTIIYQARAHIALNDPKAALNLIPADSENVALKAVAALARYVSSEAAEQETILEELRDLAVEIEGDDVEGSGKDKALVRVLAGTAFARAGEVEEALETLGVSTETEDLEAYVNVSLDVPSEVPIHYCTVLA